MHSEPGIGLAHARLSIIDLETGRQPIRNESGSVWVSFNGEIFNYIELREELERAGHRFYTHTDTEVIVHAYEEHGLDFVHLLNGQFAIALWDASKRRLVLVRDRVGIRPLYFAETETGLAFSSEVKGIFAGGFLEARLDVVGLAQSFTFWGCIPPRTPFAGVSALPPGHLAVFQSGRLSLSKYWDWEFPETRTETHSSLEDTQAELGELLEDCVRLQLRADVPVGAYLSGGLDSSAVTAAATRFTSARLKTFSLNFSDAEFDEKSYQERVARALSVEHNSLLVRSGEIGEALPKAIWHIEAPVVRTAAVPLMLLAGRVREAGLKVVLTGEGADEVFAGYDIFKEARIRRFWGRQPGSRIRPQLLRRLYPYLRHSPVSSASLASGHFGRALDQPDGPFFAHGPRWASSGRTIRFMTSEARAVLEHECPDGSLSEAVPRPRSTWTPLARDQYVEAHTLLSGYLLHAQGDRVAMANSVESRYPFLDHRLIEFANRLPDQWKLRGLDEKYILKKACHASIPTEVASRVKQPYRSPDAVSCFSGGQPLGWVADALSAERVRNAGYFDPVMVQRLVDKCRHGNAIGFADNMAFMSILTTQSLHEQFVGPDRHIA